MNQNQRLKNIWLILLTIGIGLSGISCTKNNAGGTDTQSGVGSNLVVDTIAPVPIVNENPANYSVYLRNIGKSDVKGLSFNIGNNAKSEIFVNIAGSNKISNKASPIIDSSNCSNIVAGSSCKINITDGSVGILELNGVIDGKIVTPISNSTYPLTVTDSGDLRNALVLGNYPSKMVLKPDSSGNYFGAMSFSVVNQYNGAIDVTNLLGTLPTNVTWSAINCPNPLPFARGCQVRLTYNGPKSSDVTANLRPSGEVINADGTKTPLPTQSSNGGVGVTDSKIANLNVAYPNLSLNGNTPTTGNIAIGYITNNGTNRASISGITINNDPSGIFSISDNNCTGQIAANSSCQYTITADVSKISSLASGNYSKGITVAYNNGVSNTQASGQISYSYLAVSQSGNQIVVTPGLSISGIIPSSIYAGESDAATVQLTLTNNTTATNGGNTTIEVARNSLTNSIGTNLSGTLNTTGITTNACNISGSNISLNGSQSCVVNLVLTASTPSTTTATISPTYQYYSHTSTSTTPNLTNATGAQLSTLSGGVTINARMPSLNISYWSDSSYTTSLTNLTVEQSISGVLKTAGTIKIENTGTAAITGFTLPTGISSGGTLLAFGTTANPSANTCGNSLAAGASCRIGVELNSSAVVSGNLSTYALGYIYSNHLGSQSGNIQLPSLAYSTYAPTQPNIQVSTSVDGCGTGSITSGASWVCNLNLGNSGAGTVGGHTLTVTYTNTSTTAVANNFIVTTPSSGAVAQNYDMLSKTCNGGNLGANSSCSVTYNLPTSTVVGSFTIDTSTSLGSYSYLYGTQNNASSGSVPQTNPTAFQVDVAQPSLSLSLSSSSIAVNGTSTVTGIISNWYATGIPGSIEITSGTSGTAVGTTATCTNNGSGATCTGTLTGAAAGTTNISSSISLPNGASIVATTSPLPLVLQVTPPTHFVAYYPTIAHPAPGGTSADCTVNNTGASVTGTCECIRDPNTNKIWTAVGPNNTVTTGSWNDWTGISLTTYNSTAHCGLTGGWGLPSAPSPGYGGFMSSSKPEGDWGSIAIAAGMDGNPFPLGAWMNNNGFKNINIKLYYWSSQSNPNGNAWDMILTNGVVRYTDKRQDINHGILLVHSGQ